MCLNDWQYILIANAYHKPQTQLHKRNTDMTMWYTRNCMTIEFKLF